MARADGVLRSPRPAGSSHAAIAAIDIPTALTVPFNIAGTSERVSRASIHDRRPGCSRSAIVIAGRSLAPSRQAWRWSISDCAYLISRGLAAADGRSRTLHVTLSNASLLKLMPRAYGKYEVAALVDERGRFVARSIADSERFGLPSSAALRSSLKTPRQIAFYRGTTLEGTGTYTAFARSEVTGWSAHVAMRSQRIDNPLMGFWISIGAVEEPLMAAAQPRRARKIEIQESTPHRKPKLEALASLRRMAHESNLLTPIGGRADRLKRQPISTHGKAFARAT